MKYTGSVYRPPFEARSLLLQVTVGCSHNKCAFCTMYREVPFSVESLDQIESDILEAKESYPNIKRVFLENGDAFVLSADKLKAIALLIHKHLKKVETIAMYASILNIKSKTDQELRELRALGINELNIGVESGLDEALVYLNKGYDAKTATEQLLRLNKVGIDFGLNIIFGAYGREYSRQNAIETAKLINETKPYLIFTSTIHADKGCPLFDEMQSGRFKESTIGEYLDEEEFLLNSIDIPCYYFGLHPSNVVPMHGMLPQDKDALLSAIQNTKNSFSPTQLASIPQRADEGAIIRA